MIKPEFLGCRVVPAGIPWITAQQPLDPELSSLRDAIFCYGFTGIMGACWSKSAGRRIKRADHVLIAMYQFDHDSAHRLSTLLNSIFKLPPRISYSRGPARFAITTKSSLRRLTPCWRKTSLIALFTRFLSAAPGRVFLPITIPSLAFFLLLRTKKILKCPSAMLSAQTTWSKPSLRNNRCAAVNLQDELDREFCTALGAARIDNGAATARLHAHQETMGAFSFGYGGLVCAFHVFSWINGKARYYKVLIGQCQVYFTFLPVDKFAAAL